MTTNNGKTSEMLEFNFPKPKEKQSIGQIFYNNKDGTILGRTPSSWGKIVLFYIIFYIVLAGMFAICMQGLFSTLSDSEPKWKLDESLIGTNPGLGYRPLSEETERGSVIQFDTKKEKEGRYWKELLDDFLTEYNGTNANRKYCNYNQTHSPSRVCVVDVDAFGPCAPQQGYGYKNGRPCVFLKLNKIFNWVPQFYDNPKELPEDMPTDLKDYITSLPQLERQKIWISCKGHHKLDDENIGEFKFYPTQGFPAYYYPYLKQEGYLSPLIAVQFEKLTINQMVSVECRAWAKNIIYSGSSRDRKGSVAFQLFID